VAVAAGGVYARSEYRLRATFDVPEHAPLRLAADSVTLARGRRVADVRGCTDCHGARLEGRVLMDNPLVGRLAPPNLTAGRGGRGASSCRRIGSAPCATAFGATAARSS
jgi:hypothetical protein